MVVPSGVCPNCGSQHHGWALLNPRHQSCPKCGSGLRISADGQVFEGYSPFNAQKLTTERKAEIPPIARHDGENQS